MKIRRGDLYKAVWEKPVRALAKEWSISDVGLAKACRNHGIPLPGLGHWAKVAVGRGPASAPLKGDPEALVTFAGDPSLRKVELLTEGQERVGRAVKVLSQALSEAKEDPPCLGIWTKRTAAVLNRKPDSYGFLNARGKTFSVSISEGTRDETIRILNMIERALAEAGMKWEVREEEACVVGSLYGESVSFSISERYTRSEHIEAHPEHRWLDKKIYTFHFTGDLTLRIAGWYDGRKSWSDGKTQRLSGKIPEVIEGFIAAADGLRRKKIELEEQRIRWAEEARRRVERERIEREEQEFLASTIKEANDWMQANTIRAYAAHIRGQIVERTIQLTEAGEEWVRRVEESAEKLDSVMKRLGQ